MSFADFVTEYWMLWALAATLAVALVLSFIPDLLPGARQVSPAEVTRLINRERAVVLDLRPEAAFTAGHLPGAVRVDPARDLERIRTLTRDRARPVVLHADDNLACMALCRSLAAQGSEQVYRLKGGLAAWRAAGLPLAGGSHA
jgi:rhodanese-related sulfurtransferase